MFDLEPERGLDPFPNGIPWGALLALGIYAVLGLGITRTSWPFILTLLLLMFVWRVTHRHPRRHYLRGGALIAWLVPALHLLPGME